MAWIFLAESGASVSHSSPGSEQLPIVNETDSLSQSYFRECLMDDSTELRSGMTSQPSKDQCCHQSTSSLVDFHARTSVLQEMVQAWLESEVDYSTKLSGLQKKLSHRLYSLKMCQPLELEVFKKSSEHLPIFGMTVGGLVYLPQALEPLTEGKDGSYLPTPTASTAGTNGKKKCKLTGKWINPRPSLATMASKNLWPTPVATDWKHSSHKQGNRKSKNLGAKVGGKLNPTWVEWLMGFPLEWTVLNASVMQWFHFKQKKHLKG